MKHLNVGALRRAHDPARLAAANDLVQRTLAQHGLVAPQGATPPTSPPEMPDLSALLNRFSGAAPRPVTLPEGASFADETYSCAEGSRRYRLYVPASASDDARGVIMMLHGCTQTPEDFAIGTGMNELADRHGFVVVYPAQSRGDNAQSCWNWFSRGDQRRGRGEPAILAGLAQEICAAHDVDRSACFVAGLSAGAAMAVILGEAYPDVFAAVGAHSGLPVGAAKDVPSAFAAMSGQALDAPDPVPTQTPARTIVFHGSADTTVNPSNGAAIARRAREALSPDSLGRSETGTAQGRCYTRDQCHDTAGRTLVEHWTVAGQSHAWSGGRPGGSYVDSQGPDASAEMVRFFFEHSEAQG
ncbi:alpha/beta hydrolase family esterase [Dinoroseobacter sp. S375]|uniref:extracellular catalytic domain type 1 short-chain-length polyhydroxyalkanoate depolymerase n=1 Tax=Dinoroseobacter sp. S375 TaxID=3415136 RepID=UPI003C7989AD